MVIDSPIGSQELTAADIFNETVIDQLPVGIVVLDHQGYVVKYNRFEECLARRRRQDVIGRSFFEDVAVCTDRPEIAGVFHQHIESNTLNSGLEFEFALPFLPEPREVKLHLHSFALQSRIYGLMMVEDVTPHKELERERERLVSILMHDLNNELGCILNHTALFSAGARGELEGRQQAALGSIGEAAKNMKRLISSTLAELSGQADDRKLINLHALLLSVLGNQLPAAREKGVQIFYEGLLERAAFPSKAVVIRGRVAHLSSMMQNLLSNAVKYAQERIDLALGVRGGEIVLEVKDDGPGIDPAHHQAIFDHGYQAPDSKPGEGIGLYSVRRTVLEHHGTLEVESEPGQGAIFRVKLPQRM